MQGKFNGGTFVRVFLGHLFFPFSLPFVIGCDGMVAAANFEFVFVGTFGTILNSYIMPIGMWVLLAMSMMSGNTDGRTHLLTLMAVASYVTRLFVIALKYSLLSSVDLARLMTRRLQSAQSSEWLLGGWGEPTSRCLRDQLLQAQYRAKKEGLEIDDGGRTERDHDGRASAGSEREAAQAESRRCGLDER